MATVVVGCMCLLSTMVEGMQIQPKGDLPTCFHGNCTNQVQSCAKFDAHTQYICQVINSNRYCLVTLLVAMVTLL